MRGLRCQDGGQRDAHLESSHHLFVLLLSLGVCPGCLRAVDTTGAFMQSVKAGSYEIDI